MLQVGLGDRSVPSPSESHGLREKMKEAPNSQLPLKYYSLIIVA